MAPGRDGAAALARADEALSGWDLEGGVAHLAAAVRDFSADGDVRAASMASARLADLYQNSLGNRTAARPWYARAIRLLEDQDPCVEQGWAAVAAMGCDVDDPELLLARADLALERARRFGDADLEVKALADGGLARVEVGDVEAGMAMIDDAMALACADADHDTGVIGRSVCSFYTACYHTADFERVESWTSAFRRRSILGQARGPQAILSSHCGSVQGSLLFRVGRWQEAEEVLIQAYADIEEAMPGVAWHPPIVLAELRILQGRLDEAEVLLLGRDDHMEALVPTAALYLARGDADLAAAAAHRGLRSLSRDRIRAATLLGVLVEAELARGALEAAAAASSDLDERVADLPLPALRAEASRRRAMVRAAAGDVDGAVLALREGLDELVGVNVPLGALALHADLARLLETSDRAAAVIEARAAAALLARLDVVVAMDDAALLRRLGGGPGPSRPACRVATLSRDGSWWTAGCADTKVRLRDTKGLRYLADLVGHPGVERHVLDLVDLVEGVDDVAGGAGVDRRHLGNAGPVADAASRAAYRRRLLELRDDIEAALDQEDDDRAAVLQAQYDELVSELSRAFGLGGRVRTASSAAEKARLNVTRAVRSALGKLSEALPEGAVLDRRVRTGVFCAYRPDPADEVTWTVRS
jgi:tetratricopeptide (TPR) repeat protein